LQAGQFSGIEGFFVVVPTSLYSQGQTIQVPTSLYSQGQTIQTELGGMLRYGRGINLIVYCSTFVFFIYISLFLSLFLL